MSKQLYCSYRACFNSITFSCLLGKFPMDCENCDCKEKKYIEKGTRSFFLFSLCHQYCSGSFPLIRFIPAIPKGTPSAAIRASTRRQVFGE